MLSIQSASSSLPLIVFILFGFNLIAQDFELLKIQSAYYPSQNIEESAIEGEIGFFEWGAQVAIPQTFTKSKSTILIHRFSYGNLSVNTGVNLPLGKEESKRYYHTIFYNFGLIQTLDRNWRLVVNLTPTLASDFRENLSGEDLLFQANTLVVNTKNKKLKYGFGLAYTTRFGRQLLIPTGLLKWNTGKFDLDILLPHKLNIMFKTPNNTLSFGLKAGLNGGVFNNTSEVTAVSNMIDEVGYSRLIIGPAITFRLKKAINISLQGGMAVRRRLEFIDNNNEIFDRTPKTAPFLSVGLSFAPKHKTSEAGLND